MPPRGPSLPTGIFTHKLKRNFNAMKKIKRNVLPPGYIPRKSRSPVPEGALALNIPKENWNLPRPGYSPHGGKRKTRRRHRR